MSRVIYSVGAWVVVYGWRLTGGDVIGTEFTGGNAWILAVFVIGLVLFLGGALAGGVDLGVRLVIGELAGRSLWPVRLAIVPARAFMSRPCWSGCGRGRGGLWIGCNSR